MKVCEICGERGSGLLIDHPEKHLDYGEGVITICKRCHVGLHRGLIKKKTRPKIVIRLSKEEYKFLRELKEGLGVSSISKVIGLLVKRAWIAKIMREGLTGWDLLTYLYKWEKKDELEKIFRIM